MSLETFIQAMPKIDVHLQFEGALSKETIMRVVDQNDIAASLKHREYTELMGYLNKPDYKKMDDIARTYASWLRYPEDLSRAVYELGVALHKQNVRYAEVFISPAIYTDNGLAFEQFLDAINDGRDKALRGWKVRMDWVLTIPRDRPRKGDDISRWAISAMARKGNVIGMGVSGREDVQPISQFSKTLAAVEKKDLPTVAHVRSMPNAEPLAEILSALNVRRMTDVWGVVSDPEAFGLLVSRNTPLTVTPTREVRLGRIPSVKEYPLQALLAELPVTLASGMPELYRTNLQEEYLNVAKSLELSVEDIEKLMFNAIEMSFLPTDGKESMLGEFQLAFADLRVTHLA
jgi:adenosine deaminase